MIQYIGAHLVRWSRWKGAVRLVSISTNKMKYIIAVQIVLVVDIMSPASLSLQNSVPAVMRLLSFRWGFYSRRLPTILSSCATKRSRIGKRPFVLPFLM
jgi:hypothetical protein